MNAFFILKTHTTCFSFQYKWPNKHLTMKIRVANEIIRHALSRKPLWVNNIYLLIRIKVEKTIPALWTSRVRCLTRKLRLEQFLRLRVQHFPLVFQPRSFAGALKAESTNTRR